MRRGLTLIELLVTIVIMVTVLGAVLPMISPNNDARKIRESARMLSSMMSQAKAKAAADGRPCGISFTESGVSAPFSGMALEAFFIAEPQSFSGFSEHSRVTVSLTPLIYGTGTATPPQIYNGGTRYPAMQDKRICELTFRASGGLDAFPPRTLKIGDVIEVTGNRFMICDDDKPNEMPNKVELIGGRDDSNERPIEYLASDPSAAAPTPGTVLYGIWLNDLGQALPNIPTPPVGQAYRTLRQPTKTSEAPVQFPRGIGIDMQASGVDIDGSGVPSSSFDFVGPTTVSIMFSPNGSLASVHTDGVELPRCNQVYLLMGNFENGNASVDFYDFAANVPADNADVDDRRSKVNWLNPDAMWVTAKAASGRVVSAENHIFPLSQDVDPDGDGLKLAADKDDQLAISRKHAKGLEGSSGR